MLQIFMKYCSDHSMEPFTCQTMKLKIFLEGAFTNLKWDADKIWNFLSELSKQHSNSNLCTDPLLVQAHQIFKQRQEIRVKMPKPARNLGSDQIPQASNDSKPSKDCAVCKSAKNTAKHYGSSSYTCDACRTYYLTCLLSSAPPKQPDNCQGECIVNSIKDRRKCGACRFSKLHGLGMEIPDLSTKLT